MSDTSMIGMQQCLRIGSDANQVLVSALSRTRVGAGMEHPRIGRHQPSVCDNGNLTRTYAGDTLYTVGEFVVRQRRRVTAALYRIANRSR
jgi:hypothetical protein